MRKSVCFAVCLVLGCLLAAPPAWPENFPTLSARQLKSIMDGGEKIFLWNPLSDIEFNEGHIQGSVNIPFGEAKASSKLPSKKDTPIVTYCLGPK